MRLENQISCLRQFAAPPVVADNPFCLAFFGECIAKRIQYINREKALRDWNSSIHDPERRGEKRFALLTSQLLSDKRFSDLQRAADDPDFRNFLYDEYHI